MKNWQKVRWKLLIFECLGLNLLGNRLLFLHIASYCRNTVTEEYSIDFTLNGETKHIPLPKNTYNMPNTYI